MTDQKKGANLLFLREDELREAMELLFFAYRDFTGVADAILTGYGFGRAHHRAIYFVGRHPGITVSELLALLHVTKQSLSRVLSQLVEEGFITQRTGEQDRRQRRLTLTQSGIELERHLTESQRARVARAFQLAGPEAVGGFRRVMLGLLDGTAQEERGTGARAIGSRMR